MTNDHIDDFISALDHEKRAFFILVHGGKDKPRSGANVSFDIDNWPEIPGNDMIAESKAHDLLLFIACALSQGSEKFEVIKIK